MSLAITEKRHRPGGCAGIFFQLFDWNRRFAKKKLFSHKFLPPVRDGKRTTKKLYAGGADDKMPMANKLLLIADENRGGFPAPKKLGAEAGGSGNGMRAPGLVARLMGLETMPVVNHTKLKKASHSDRIDARDVVGENHWLDQDLCPDEGGQGRVEVRAPKVQKTAGFLERRFSPDMLSKSVLSRAKRQHNKLSSPVRSPRMLSKSSTTRLMQAASKILEPGLHSRSRSRCALTYIDPLQHNADRIGVQSSLNNSKEAPIRDSLVGSWRSCDGVVEISEFTFDTREPLQTDSPPCASDYSNRANASSSHYGCIEEKMKPAVTPCRRDRTASPAAQAKVVNVQSRACDFPKRKNHSCTNQDQRKPWQDANSRPALKNNHSRKNQLPTVRDREVHATSSCSRKPRGKNKDEINGAKDFSASNRNLNECSHMSMRSATKVSNNYRLETDKNGWENSSARKRRPTSGPQIENVGGINTTFLKQRSVGTGSTNRKGAGLIRSRSINRNCAGSGLPKKADSDSPSGSKDNGIVSFTFSSQMRHGSTTSASREKKENNMAHGELSHGALYSKLASDTKAERLSLRGDQLSVLLEQKIKQMTSLDTEDSDTVNLLPGKSCAAGYSTSENSFRDSSDISDCTISHNQILNIKETFQEEEKTGISASYMVSDIDRPSPTSILEVSFSNDTCSVGSPCSSGGKPHIGLIDLFDSVTSANTSELDIEKTTHSFNGKTSMHGCYLHEAEFSEAKFSKAISNAQLLFENTSLYEPDGTLELFLLSILETTLEFAKEENQLRDLQFDCIMECLDSKYGGGFCGSGYRAWLKVPILLRRDRLLRELNEEIRGWGDFAGKGLDVLIEKEISLSAPKWRREFEIEEFETGIEIENEMFEALVDEMVVDICSR